MRNIAASTAVLLTTWFAGLAVARFLGIEGMARDLALALLFMATLAASLALRATIAGYVLAGLCAFIIAESAARALWGQQSVQGGPTHFAVLGAGFLGVALGALISAGVVSRFFARVASAGATKPHPPAASTRA